VSEEGPVRVRLRYTDLDTFIQKFAPNVSRGGLFLASKTPRPVGGVIRFEVLLRDGEQAVLAGEGKVTWVKAFDPQQPAKPHGMGVQFLRLDTHCRQVLDRILKAKANIGAPVGADAPPTSASAAPALDGSSSSATPISGAGAGADLEGLLVELGLEETQIRRALERARTWSARSEDLEALTPGPITAEPASLSRALADLPRLLASPGRTRRRTGPLRPLEGVPAAPRKPEHGGSNGVT